MEARKRHYWIYALVALPVCCTPDLAAAGPPLISDDPHTVGPGVVQPISSMSVWHWGDEALLRGPIADITAGLVDSLDLLVVASLESANERSASPSWTQGGLFAAGFKWEFFRRERGSLAFTPVFIWDSRFPTRPAGLLPVQGELAVGGGRTRIGFDLGYIPIRGEPHDWLSALYVNWDATRRLGRHFGTPEVGSEPELHPRTVVDLHRAQPDGFGIDDD